MPSVVVEPVMNRSHTRLAAIQSGSYLTTNQQKTGSLPKNWPPPISSRAVKASAHYTGTCSEKGERRRSLDDITAG